MEAYGSLFLCFSIGILLSLFGCYAVFHLSHYENKALKKGEIIKKENEE